MTKHIVLIINKLGEGGAERVVQTLSNYFCTLGYRVTVISLQGGKLAYDMPKNVTIVTLTSSFLGKGFGNIFFLWLFAAEIALKLRKLKPDGVLSFLVGANILHIMTKWFGNKNQYV